MPHVSSTKTNPPGRGRRQWLLLLPLLLLLAASRLHAQTAPAPTPAAAPGEAAGQLLPNGWYLPRYAPRGAEADTTGALLALFHRRRSAGLLYTIPLIAGLSLALPISSTDAAGQTTVAAESISTPLGVAVLAGTVVGFIVHAAKFNPAHLRAVTEAYAAGQPVPGRYRRLLHAGHFAEAAFLRRSLDPQLQWDQPPPQLPKVR